MEVQKQRKSRSNLCEYFDKTREEMQEVISKLPQEDRNFLQDLYGSDYSRIIPRGTKIDKNRQMKIFYHINQILKNYQVKIRKSRNNLCEYFGKTKEEMQEVISKLPKEDKEFLQELYDTNYSEFIREENELDYTNLVIIFYHINQVLKKHQVKTRKSRDNLCEYFGKSKEEIQGVISKLPKEDKEFLQDLYGSDYSKTIPQGIKIDRYRQQNVFYYINQALKNRQVKTRKSRNDLCKYLDKTKEELDEIVSQLSVEQQTFLRELYTENYQKKDSKQSLNKKQIDNLTFILTKMNQLLSGKKVRKIKSRNDLCKYLDKTKEELDEIVPKLSVEQQTFLSELYTENYQKKDSKQSLSRKQTNSLTTILTKMNQLLSGKKVRKTKSTPQSPKKEEFVVEEDLTEEDIENLSKMFNQDSIEKQAKQMPIEESIIFILRNKIYESKEFSVEAISKFLQEDPKTIKKIEKMALMTLKKQLTSLDSELEESEHQKILSLKG